MKTVGVPVASRCGRVRIVTCTVFSVLARRSTADVALGSPLGRDVALARDELTMQAFLRQPSRRAHDALARPWRSEVRFAASLFDAMPAACGPRDDLEVRDVRTVWISDVHLGTRGSATDLLLEFLERHRCEHLYLVGDILDGWALRRSWFWNQGHNEVVQAILRASLEGTRVTYVCGNHDEFLRSYIGLLFGDVLIQDEAVHETADGRRMLVIHGDAFDVCIRHAKWLAHLGDRAYRFTLHLNTWVNRIRRRLGHGYWSLSAYLKQRVKVAVSTIDDFERAVREEAQRRGFDGVVCGHIHKAEVREADGFVYCNDGDWVESCTALVEDEDGRLEIVDWAREREDWLAREAAAAARTVAETRASALPLRAHA